MISHKVKVYPSKISLPKKNQLAWKIAEIASDNAKLDKNSIEMVINRIIDNASVAIASLNRHSVISSREMALKHLRNNGATLFGINSKLKFVLKNTKEDYWLVKPSLKGSFFMKPGIIWGVKKTDYSFKNELFGLNIYISCGLSSESMLNI